MFGLIGDVWAELVAVVVAAVLGWWSKHYWDRNHRKR